MEDETSKSYQSRLKSHLELLIDFEEVNGDEELMTIYPCPFCEEDFDLLELCFHIDLDHPIEAESGICPVCAMWVGTNIVDHITAQHGDLFKISFLIFIIEMILLRHNK
ncbi:putative drought induced 19 type, zinc-binding protein [Medicago truncatula]|uniref:Putative drought induced 19 type, zinc-binding protein n=1 Tax=Medicago truncatula TaxID=3880 RepID=A0A396H8C2_MEDTR|nr:putative drought induced 19 type, zinc-binding protein [Medicago truncatula]